MSDHMPEMLVHVICTTGNRSKAVAHLLVAAGVDAASVATGTQGWVAAGHPVGASP